MSKSTAGKRLKRQQHILCSEASVTAGAGLCLSKRLQPVPATAFPLGVGGSQMSLPTRVIQPLRLTGKRGVGVQGLTNCKPSLEARQLPDS